MPFFREGVFAQWDSRSGEVGLIFEGACGPSDVSRRFPSIPQTSLAEVVARHYTSPEPLVKAL